MDNYIVGPVKGRHPVSGEEATSTMFSRIVPANADLVFQTALNGYTKVGCPMLGSKAVTVLDDYGNINVAFLTETTITHHRHAAATLFGLEDSRALALYEGDASRAKDLMNRCAGFQLQYNTQSKLITGIHQQSWMTNLQLELLGNGKPALDAMLEESMVLKMLESIDPALLVDKYQTLDWLTDDRMIRFAQSR